MKENLMKYARKTSGIGFRKHQEIGVGSIIKW
jgi:hypothetical protein